MTNLNPIPRIKNTNPFFSSVDIYAVLDGAAVPGLLKKLYKFEPEHICLYRGELAPDLREVAPYLVKLEYDSDFTNWILEEGWGKHWGIFAATDADMKEIRKHFRKLLMVQYPDGKPTYFRFYDPRIFRRYLPTCNKEETKMVFGPVKFFLLESIDIQTVTRFMVYNGLPYKEELKLGV